jgi:hypothetical protein
MKRFLAVFTLALIAADTDPLATDKALQKADERYTAAVAKAQEDFNVLKAKENEKRLKAYKTALESATRAGNFDKATALKARIAEYEAGGARPRPKDVVKFGGHSYALISDKATWHVAKRRCEEMGGHLVAIETAMEEQFVKQLCGQVTAWVGASDEDEEGIWKWVTGERIELRIQSDNPEDNSLALYKQVWHDVTPGTRYAYICEWDQ